jgi:hypothetical protein
MPGEVLNQNVDQTGQRRPLLPLLVLHGVAAVACFAFFTVAPIVVCLVFMVAGKDGGGPMFFPIFVVGAVSFAAIITVFLAGAALASDLLRRHCHVPLWLPPLAVLFFATLASWPFLGRVHAVIPLIAGAVVTLAFIIHWAAISTVWCVPRLLIRLLNSALARRRAG